MLRQHRDDDLTLSNELFKRTTEVIVRRLQAARGKLISRKIISAESQGLTGALSLPFTGCLFQAFDVGDKRLQIVVADIDRFHLTLEHFRCRMPQKFGYFLRRISGRSRRRAWVQQPFPRHFRRGTHHRIRCRIFFCRPRRADRAQ